MTTLRILKTLVASALAVTLTVGIILEPSEASASEYSCPTCDDECREDAR